MTNTAISELTVSAQSLTRSYGANRAVRDVSLELRRGEVLGLLGPNGAGKTTTMQMLTGNLAPSSGQVRICGIDLIDRPIQAKSRIGYLPEVPPLYKELKVDEYLRLAGRLHKVKKPALQQAVERARQRCGLSDMGKRLIGSLSKGYQQRVGIAQAIIHEPDVIILDEPTIGLDPNQIREIRSLIRDLGRAFDEVAAGDARALLITGAGTKAFCAGADIRELTGRSLAAQKRDAEIGQATFAKLDRLPMPSVAIINGYAFGGGLELALACTFRIATKNARMGQPEIKLGLIPGYGGTQRLPRVVGEAHALEMIMTGRTVDAEEAHRIGLVNRILDGDALAQGIAFAREFSGYSLPVLGLAREAVTRALDNPVSEGLRIEADLSTLAFRTEDAAEGMDAFIAKRKPHFKDK